jgi:hypothetical protein
MIFKESLVNAFNIISFYVSSHVAEYCIKRESEKQMLNNASSTIRFLLIFFETSHILTDLSKCHDNEFQWYSDVLQAIK